MFVANNGASSEAILKQLRSSGALVELIKVMKYYLIDQTDVADITDISPMVQALSLLSSRSLPTKEDDRKIQRDVALQLLKQFSTADPPGISFVSAGIIGHAAAILSNLVAPSIKNSSSATALDDEDARYLAGLFEAGDRNILLLNNAKQFFL